MLELDGLVRRFGEVTALDGLDLTVAPGELCGFVGANGAGKTTAMRCAVGVSSPDSGSVRWQGRPVDLEVRRTIGYMPEERGLYPRMRVEEQLIYLARLHGRSASDATTRAAAWIDRLGLTERRWSNVEELSLGNQQRVQLAAALVHDPVLLVLDEPFSGLDPLAVEVMSEVLREQADAGVAVVFSSHQLELVEDLCRTLAVVAEGRVILRGEVAALRRQGARRLRIGIDGGDEWLAQVPPMVGVERRHDGSVTLVLPSDQDAGELLDLARRAGTLERVQLEEPRLAEVFRDATSARS